MAYVFTSVVWLGGTGGLNYRQGQATSNTQLFASNDPQVDSLSHSFGSQLISGSIPGLTWSANPTLQDTGGFVGTPTAAGTYTVTVQATYTRNPGAITGVSFQAGEIFIDPNGHVQQCVVAGQSAASGTIINWNDTGGTTSDGTITWQDQGVATGVPATTCVVQVRTTNPTIDGFGNPIGVSGQAGFFSQFGTLTPSPSYSLAVVGGTTMPPGLGFIEFTGSDYSLFAIAGQTSFVGSTQVAIQVTGSLGDVDVLYVPIVMLPGQVANYANIQGLAGPTVTVTPHTGSPLSYQLAQSLGSQRKYVFSPATSYAGPYTFSKQGTWPSYLTLTSSGLISGTIPAGFGAGTFGGDFVEAHITSAAGNGMNFIGIQMTYLGAAATTGQRFHGTSVGVFGAGKVGGGTL